MSLPTIPLNIKNGATNMVERFIKNKKLSQLQHLQESDYNLFAVDVDDTSGEEDNYFIDNSKDNEIKQKYNKCKEDFNRHLGHIDETKFANSFIVHSSGVNNLISKTVSEHYSSFKQKHLSMDSETVKYLTDEYVEIYKEVTRLAVDSTIRSFAKKLLPWIKRSSVEHIYISDEEVDTILKSDTYTKTINTIQEELFKESQSKCKVVFCKRKNEVPERVLIPQEVIVKQLKGFLQPWATKHEYIYFDPLKVSSICKKQQNSSSDYIFIKDENIYPLDEFIDQVLNVLVKDNFKNHYIERIEAFYATIKRKTLAGKYDFSPQSLSELWAYIRLIH